MARIALPTPCLLAVHAADPKLAAGRVRAWFDDVEYVALASDGAPHASHGVRALVDERLRDRRLVVVHGRAEPTGLRNDLVRLAKIENHFCVAIRVGDPDAREEQRWRSEGFREVWTVAEDEQVEIERVPLRNDRRELTGPFDIVGDVHGCREELEELLAELGYVLRPGERGPIAVHPAGRRLVFVGDLVDRGPDSPGVLRLALASVLEGDALCVPGNHEAKLRRWLKGSDVKHAHGFAETVEQLAGESEEFLAEVAAFIDDLSSHLLLDGGALCIAHAGLPARLQGRASRRVRSHCLYGETTGETNASGYPVRVDWAKHETGGAFVVYGHTPVDAPKFAPRAVCIDTGCVFGGALTALRWPERELVSVPAKRAWFVP